MNKNKLPNRYKKIGFGIVALSLLGTIFAKIVFNNPEWMIIPKYTVLVGLLMVSLSKEKIEDELIASLRLQSYTFAFIAVVLSVLITPITTFIMSSFRERGLYETIEGSDWQIVWLLLFLQIFFFEVLKRRHNEK